MLTPWFATFLACGGGGGDVVPWPGDNRTIVGYAADDLWVLDARLGAEQDVQGPDMYTAMHWDGAAWSEPHDVVEEIEDGLGFSAWLAPLEAGAAVVISRDDLVRVDADGTLTPLDSLDVDPVSTGGRAFAALDGVMWGCAEGSVWRNAGDGWEERPAPFPLASSTIVPVGPDAAWFSPSGGGGGVQEGAPALAYWDGATWLEFDIGANQEWVAWRFVLGGDGDVYATLDGLGSVMHCGSSGCETVGLDVGEPLIDGVVSMLPTEDGAALLTLESVIGGEFDKNVTRKFEAWSIDIAAGTASGRRVVATLGDRCEAGCDPMSGNGSSAHLADGSVAFPLSDGFAVIPPLR